MELRYSFACVDFILYHKFLDKRQFDIYLAQSIGQRMNYASINIGMRILQHFVIEHQSNDIFMGRQDLRITIEVLRRIATCMFEPPEGLVTLLELLGPSLEPRLNVEMGHGPATHNPSGISQGNSRDHGAPPGFTERTHYHLGGGDSIYRLPSAQHLNNSPTMFNQQSRVLPPLRYYYDPPELWEKTEYLLNYWITIYNSPLGAQDPDRAFSIFFNEMNVHGIVSSGELTGRFFRFCTKMMVEHCYRSLPYCSAEVCNKILDTVDTYVKLIALSIKHLGDGTNSITIKVELLNTILRDIAGILQQDQRYLPEKFHHLPFQRILNVLFHELNAPEPLSEAIHDQMLTAYYHTLHAVRPTEGPGFVYAWLELISDSSFIGCMLDGPSKQKSWFMYASLIIDLFKYLAPFLRNSDSTRPFIYLYRGTVRVILVIAHDFPDFVGGYYCAFCDVLPSNGIQLINLLLSAHPKNAYIPCPFTPYLRLDDLSGKFTEPRILTDYALLISPASFKKSLNCYLRFRMPVTFLTDLRSNLQDSNEPGRIYNIPLINNLVLYVGHKAIEFIREIGLSCSPSTIPLSPHMDIFKELAENLCTEGRYVFLTAIANQLRFPSSHTFYFSFSLLHLFSTANSHAIKEQIARVLVERLMVCLPHPWGVLITFIELVNNPFYKIWDCEFVSCAPEIERLFKKYARPGILPRYPQPFDLEQYFANLTL